MGQTESTPVIDLVLLSNKEQAQEALHRAEEVDRYLEECQEDRANRLSRRDTTYSANRITYYELKYVEVALEHAQSRIPLRLVTDLKKVFLVPLMPSADGGMPHTRPGELICCPDISRISNTTTLIHELWHVHQRMYEEGWSRIFREWDWTPLDEEGDGAGSLIPPRIEAARRYNPDTIDSPFWVYRRTWIPVPVFKDIAHPSVLETEVWFIHATEGYHVRTVPSELRQMFPSAPDAAFEHPREMAAYLLSEPERHHGTPGFEVLRSLVGQNALPRT